MKNLIEKAIKLIKSNEQYDDLQSQSVDVLRQVALEYEQMIMELIVKYNDEN